MPLAYILARGSFRGRGVIQSVVDLPLVVPHTVAGIALLFLLGRTGWVGGPAAHLGVSFYGSQWGIVAAMLFVSAPFAVNSARVAFEAIDPRLERAARSLGASPWHAFRRITLPLGLRGVLTGAVLVYARSISEFGAVVIIAYYPATAPVRDLQPVPAVRSDPVRVGRGRAADRHAGHVPGAADPGLGPAARPG